jgi:hypothetical protein
MSLELPEVVRILLFELYYIGSTGSLVVERFSSASGPITIGDFEYEPDPALAAELPDRTGVVDEDDTEVRISNRWGTIQALASGRAFAPVTANLLEAVIDPTALPYNEVSLLHLAAGRAALISDNEEGDPGVASITIRSAKNDLEYPLDNTAVDTCRNEFGCGKTCLFDVPAAVEIGSMDALSGITATITGLPVVPLGWWERGYIKFKGVKITIRSWDGDETFKLNQLPPKLWVELIAAGSEDIEIFPGCGRRLTNCRERGQESQFRGLGFNIPFHHPNFEKLP